MEMYFNVEKEKLEEMKKIIRSLDSLRFIENPFEMSDNTYRISLSGDVQDFNKLDQYREQINLREDKKFDLNKNRKNVSTKKQNFLSEMLQNFKLNKIVGIKNAN